MHSFRCIYHQHKSPKTKDAKFRQEPKINNRKAAATTSWACRGQPAKLRPQETAQLPGLAQGFSEKCSTSANDGSGSLSGIGSF